MRLLTVLLRRNKSQDGEKDYKEGKKITYTGFDICWPDGSPTQVSFARFCKLGTRAIFGKQIPEDKDYLVDFIFKPVSKDDPRDQQAKKLYLKKEGKQARMYLPNGEETDFIFTDDDDKQVRHWIGYDELQDGQESWFEFTVNRS